MAFQNSSFEQTSVDHYIVHKKMKKQFKKNRSTYEEKDTCGDAALIALPLGTCGDQFWDKSLPSGLVGPML